MLSKTAVSTGSNFAGFLENKKILLSPKPVTLMGELVKATPNLYTDVYDTASASHDAFMDNYIVNLSNIFKTHILFARNTVMKYVRLYEEDLNNRMVNTKDTEAEDFFCVRYFKLHDVFESSLVFDEIANTSKKIDSLDSIGVNKLTITDFTPSKYLLAE